MHPWLSNKNDHMTTHFKFSTKQKRDVNVSKLNLLKHSTHNSKTLKVQ